MARSACCLALIVLCLSLVLHPAFAAKIPMSSSSETPHRHHHDKAPEKKGTKKTVLETQENPLLKQLCQDTTYTELCVKIIEGNKETWSSLKKIKKPKTSIDLAIEIALKSADYMESQLKSDRTEESVASAFQVCLRYYKDMIIDLESASAELKDNPEMAKDYLNDASYKVGFCNGDVIPPIFQTNGILLRLMRNASLRIKH